jgi:thiamine-phosphate pyrophosphorylase
LREVDFDFYLITDRTQCGGEDLVARVERALKGGVRAVQMREKDLTTRERFELGRRLRDVTIALEAKFFVNGDAALALALDADGVHLPQDSLPADVCRSVVGPDMLIGVSTHSRSEAAEAEEMGADFITFGPTYYTPSKAQYGEPVGVDSLRQVCAKVGLPVFALGGVGSSNIEQVVSAGAAGAAMISAVLAAPDPEAAASRISGALHEARSIASSKKG